MFCVSPSSIHTFNTLVRPAGRQTYDEKSESLRNVLKIYINIYPGILSIYEYVYMYIYVYVERGLQYIPGACSMYDSTSTVVYIAEKRR